MWSQGLCLFDYELHQAFKDEAEAVLEWGSNCLQKNSFPREDYRELLELIVFYLGGEVPRTFRLRKPGKLRLKLCEEIKSNY